MRSASPPEQEVKATEAENVARRARGERFGFARRPTAKKFRLRNEVQSEQSRLYKQLTPAYEMFFPLLVRRRIWDTIGDLRLAEGSSVLEVGVGTGTSLLAYPTNINVIGIDLSTEMLALAQRKIDQEGWKHIHVQPGNAEQLEFPDASFDCVTSFHTVSVVARPDQMMREIVRVLRPGGRLLIINHFRSPRPWLANMIDRADPVTRHLGWRTDLAIDAIIRSLPLQVDRCYKTSPLSLFTVIRATRLE